MRLLHVDTRETRPSGVARINGHMKTFSNEKFTNGLSTFGQIKAKEWAKRMLQESLHLKCRLIQRPTRE